MKGDDIIWNDSSDLEAVSLKQAIRDVIERAKEESSEIQGKTWRDIEWRAKIRSRPPYRKVWLWELVKFGLRNLCNLVRNQVLRITHPLVHRSYEVKIGGIKLRIQRARQPHL